MVASQVQGIAMAPIPQVGGIARITIKQTAVPDSGYLGVEADDVVKILYIGTDPSELGWVYASHASSPSDSGWVAIACLIRPRRSKQLSSSKAQVAEEPMGKLSTCSGDPEGASVDGDKERHKQIARNGYDYRHHDVDLAAENTDASILCVGAILPALRNVDVLPEASSEGYLAPIEAGEKLQIMHMKLDEEPSWVYAHRHTKPGEAGWVLAEVIEPVQSASESCSDVGEATRADDMPKVAASKSAGDEVYHLRPGGLCSQLRSEPSDEASSHVASAGGADAGAGVRRSSPAANKRRVTFAVPDSPMSSRLTHAS